MKKIILNTLSIFSILFMFALPSHANQMSQENIEKIIENFLIKNPQLLRSVLDNYKKKY